METQLVLFANQACPVMLEGSPILDEQSRLLISPDGERADCHVADVVVFRGVEGVHVGAGAGVQLHE